MFRFAKELYRKIRSKLPEGLPQQRLDMLRLSFGYRHVLMMPNIGLMKKLWLIWRFLTVDWNVYHTHRPFMFGIMCRELASRSAAPGEVVVEAGCFKGGSSIKFSLMCDLLGYHLHIFDSFEGIPEMSGKEQEMHNYQPGEWKGSYDEVIANVRRYGKIDVCEFHKGWFSDTLAKYRFDALIRLAYADTVDLLSATQDVLDGVVPQLADDGIVFSDDFHFDEVCDLLNDPATWQAYGKPKHHVTRHSISFGQIVFQP